MKSVRTLIELWPSAEVFSDDLGLKYRSHGRVMKMRNRIPHTYWTAVIEAARRRKIDGVTLDGLARLHSK